MAAREKLKDTIKSRKTAEIKAYEEFKAGEAQAEKVIVFDDAPDVETAIAKMRMIGKNNGEPRNLIT